MTDTSKSPSDEVQQLRGQLDELRATDPAARVEDVKQRVGATVSSATEAVAEPLRQGAERVRGVVDSARRTADQVSDSARRTVDQVSAQQESLSEQIRHRPFAALGIAMLAGYVFGRIVR